jgi:hypothetical protein
MAKSLQEQYNLIKEGKGAKDVFLKNVKSMFPNIIPNKFGFEDTKNILVQRGIISENLWGIATGSNEQPDWFKLFEEYTASPEEKDTKADATKQSKEVDVYQEKSKKDAYQAETGDDVIFDQYLKGIQVEACKDENKDKTVDDIKKIVLKNLKKDKLYYTKNATFSVEGIGYVEDVPGLGATKEVKGKYKSSGMEPVKLKENLYHGEIWSLEPEGPYWILTYSTPDGKKDKTFKSESEAKDWITKNLKESLTNAVLSVIKEELNIKEIESAGEEASKAAKLKRVNDEISKRKKKIKALETLKELEEDSINPKKVKELYSEIKKLESFKAKLEKKGKKEQIMDETTVVDKTTTSSEIPDIVKQEKTTPAAVTQAVNTAKTTGKPVNVAENKKDCGCNKAK